MKNMLIRSAFAAFAALFGQILLADATVPTMTPTPTATDPLVVAGNGLTLIVR